MNTAKPLLRTLPKNLVRSSALCLAFLSAATVRAQTPWLNETFGGYTNGQPLSLALSPQLINVTSPTNFTKINNDGGNVARYQKISSTGTASAPNFAFSATNNIIARTNGYVAFKLKQNTDTLAPANMTNQSWYMGIANTNPTASVNTSANRIISMQFKQSGGAPAVVSVESSGTSIVSSYNWTNSTSYALVQIWFNDSDTAPMSYTTPSGAVSTLATNCFVVYIDTNLVTTTNSGNAPLTGAGGTSLSIGKMGLGTGSTTTNIDFSFGNLYAADSAPGPTNAPTITSTNNVAPQLNVPFSYQITTDPLGATSYALTSGSLPTGLSLNTSTGVISGTATALGGPSTVVLTASNSVGTGSPFNLSLTVVQPLNTFSGSNTSLNTDTSWSLGAVPNSSTSAGSYQDVSLVPSVNDLTTTSGSLFVKSWNVTNGSSYTLTSLKTNGSTTYQMGRTANTNAFTNSVSGVANDLVYLTNNSSLTFSPLNSSATPTNSTVNLAYGGNLNISAGSILNIDAVMTGSDGTYGINKTGAGTLNLSGANTFGGSAAGTALAAGTLKVTGSEAPTRLAKIQAIAVSGVVTGLTIVDGGAGYTVAPAITISKSSDSSGSGATATATISGGQVTAVSLGNGGSGYTNTNPVTATLGITLPPRVYAFSTQSPLGVGINSFSGGVLRASVDTDISRMTAYQNGTNTFFQIRGYDTAFNGPVTLNVDAGKTLSCYTPVGRTNPADLITKTGAGTLQLRGGGATGVIADWLISDGTLFVNTTASGGLGTSNYVVLNGGNLLFSKGIGSTGSYTGQGQDAGLKVQQSGTITLNPNTNTAISNNTVSFTNLVISNQTLTVVKGPDAFCSTNPAGFTDPQISFLAATLNGSAALAVGTNVETVLRAGTGSGGLTKSGNGKLTISSGNVVTNSVTNSVPSTYTGPTVVNAGTLELGGSHASSITIGSNAVLESSLTTNSPATAGSLNFVSGAKVRIAGTASQSSYTLVTASNGIVGLPTLETAVPDYALSVSNNSLLLVATSAPLSPYGSWLTNYPSLAGSNTNGTADPDGDGFNNNMEFAFDGNPTVGSPAMISVASSGASSVFSFLASTNTAAVSYMVQSTTNLATGPWGDNSGVTATITNSANQANVPLYPSYLRREFRVTPTGTNSFYRVKATISQ